MNPISPKELIDELIQLDKDSQMLAEDVFYKNMKMRISNVHLEILFQ